MKFISTFFNDVVHLLYPRVCVGCGSDLVSNDPVCYECIADLPVTNFYSHKNNPVEKIFWGRLPVKAGHAYAYFTKASSIQNMLHELKYKGNKAVGVLMGRLIGEQLIQSGHDKADALIPLPLFPKKQKLRGYNQANVICDGINLVTGIPVWNDVVFRTAGAQSQTRKGRLDRWKDMDSKFHLANADAISKKHVMLIDDVITTGATIEACGSQLMKAPGVSLSVSAFAYTSL